MASGEGDAAVGTALTASRGPGRSLGLAGMAELEARARDLVRRGTSANTLRAYRSDMRYVSAWCEASGLGPDLPLSTEAVLRFVVDHFDGLPDDVDLALVRSGVKAGSGAPAPSTVSRRFAALSAAHDAAGVDNPCRDPQVLKLLRKARAAMRMEGWSPTKKAAAPKDVLDALLATCTGGGLLDFRDRAMLLFGWSTGGRRRSEIVAATFERLVPMGGDFVYELGITKTSQDGDTGTVPVAGRAAAALRDWLDVADIREGALFRPLTNGIVGKGALSHRGVGRVVQARAKKAGLDWKRFGGHSLRSGFMTEAGLQNVPLAEAMAMSMHRSVKIAVGYHQAGHGLSNQAARLLG